MFPITRLTDGTGAVEMTMRRLADRVGVDPWDVDLGAVAEACAAVESQPVSRFALGSPCRFVRAIDVTVHVVLPGMLAHRFPRTAQRLADTSPRWGRRQR
jgi:hypothetical protein